MEFITWVIKQSQTVHLYSVVLVMIGQPTRQLYGFELILLWH